MKTLALLFFLASNVAVLADSNLLQNGDFSDGLADWDGDCHTLNSSTIDSPLTPAMTTGVAVQLKPSDWTQVIQDFDGNVGEYVLTVTYATSPDLKFSDEPGDYFNIPGKIGFSRLMPFSSTPGQWVVIVNDLGAMHYHYWKIKPNPNASGVQTVTVQVRLSSDDTEKKGFYLLFPPGQGLINLQSISLIPKAAGNP
jgi:hypothetical protein